MEVPLPDYNFDEEEIDDLRFVGTSENVRVQEEHDNEYHPKVESGTSRILLLPTTEKLLDQERERLYSLFRAERQHLQERIFDVERHREKLEKELNELKVKYEKTAAELIESQSKIKELEERHQSEAQKLIWVASEERTQRHQLARMVEEFKHAAELEKQQRLAAETEVAYLRGTLDKEHSERLDSDRRHAAHARELQAVKQQLEQLVRQYQQIEEERLTEATTNREALQRKLEEERQLLEAHWKHKEAQLQASFERKLEEQIAANTAQLQTLYRETIELRQELARWKEEASAAHSEGTGESIGEYPPTDQPSSSHARGQREAEQPVRPSSRPGGSLTTTPASHGTVSRQSAAVAEYIPIPPEQGVARKERDHGSAKRKPMVAPEVLRDHLLQLIESHDKRQPPSHPRQKAYPMTQHVFDDLNGGFPSEVEKAESEYETSKHRSTRGTPVLASAKSRGVSSSTRVVAGTMPQSDTHNRAVPKAPQFSLRNSRASHNRISSRGGASSSRTKPFR